MNLEEEIICGYTVPQEMKKVWSIEIDLLKKLLEVCNKYNLRIWADGGTLLGAIRHKGFIPWDDDIDMAMLRTDFDKLMEIGQKEFNHPYFLQSGYSEEFDRGFARLRNSETTALAMADLGKEYNRGIFIDIFVYDSVPDDANRLNRLIRITGRLKAILSAKIYYRYKTKDIKEFIYKFVSQIIFLFVPYNVLYNTFHNFFRKNKLEECKDIACLSFMFLNYEKFRRDKSWYEKTLYVDFEDTKIPVPSGYDKILKKQYGDYMVMRKAPTYHGALYFDASKSYKIAEKEDLDKINDFFKKNN